MVKLKIEVFFGLFWVYLNGLCHPLHLAWQHKEMPARSPHAQLGDVKQVKQSHEDPLYPNTAKGLAADRASPHRHPGGGLQFDRLGRVSKGSMPNGAMANTLTHLTGHVMLHYQNLGGGAAPCFLRLFGFRAPTYQIGGGL